MSFSCFDNSNFDYNMLTNKPCVNGCILTGDMSFEDMGLVEVINCYTQQYAEECIYPTVDCKLQDKQTCLCAGQGICITPLNNNRDEIAVVADGTICNDSTNAIMNCTVSSMCCDIYDCIACERCCTDNQLSLKQDILNAGTSIKIECNSVSVCVDTAMSVTSLNPVANCVINNAIECIMSCGYLAGNGICMTTDACGNHVISLNDCISISCCLTVGGETNICGPLVIWGDIYQCGSAYCTHAEELYTCCDCIYLRDGAASPLGAGSAGIVVLNYDGTNCAILDVDETGTWRLGETDGNPHQVIATRAETCDTENNALAVWNCACQCFDTTHASDNQVLTWDNCNIASLATSCNSNHTKLKGEITNADTITMHDYQSFADLEADLTQEDREFSRYDNVAGVSCEFQICQVYDWQQDGCCIDYQSMISGTTTCPKVQYNLSIDMIGNTGITGTCTDDPDGTTCYGICIVTGASGCVTPEINEAYCSVDCVQYDPLETYVGVGSCTVCSLCTHEFTPSTSGSPVPNSYTAGNLSSLPSWCNICTSTLCYYQDPYDHFCADCTYWCFESVGETYCQVPVTAETWLPGVYFFNCEASYTEVKCYDINYVLDSLVAVPVCGGNFLSGACTAACGVRLCQTFCNSSPVITCCLTADTMCCVYTCKYDIEKVVFKTLLETNRIDVCATNNGIDYLVHSYGIPNCYMEQQRIYKKCLETRYYCCCDGCWQPWESISYNNCTVNPCPETLCGSIGTSPYAARADHSHPYAQTYCFEYINANIVRCQTTVYNNSFYYIKNPFMYEFGRCWYCERTSDSSFAICITDCCITDQNTGNPVLFTLSQYYGNDYTNVTICNCTSENIVAYYSYMKPALTYGVMNLGPGECMTRKACGIGSGVYYGFAAYILYGCVDSTVQCHYFPFIANNTNWNCHTALNNLACRADFLECIDNNCCFGYIYKPTSLSMTSYAFIYCA